MILYAAVISALLFLAFAFFAVAQAGTVRNGGQSAADAAALAAAQDDRDELFEDVLGAIGDGKDLKDLLDGIGSLFGDGCGEADHFAARNRSDVLSCDAINKDGHNGYTVKVRTRFDTGDSVVPGTGNKKAEASATAVLKPRCELTGDSKKLIEITCDGEDFTIDPDDIDLDLRPSDLFSVVLVG
ncbi:hypothetical protein [Streptomyces winkii]|uniref:hypothetical protein n=1 Tax=Streptomyces winkii TaxID=3051178 RepID=UPI0028D79DBE|nr:hypothetical protein [Streptomyces sp. DSM 40971]